MPKAPLIKVHGPSERPCNKTDQTGECILITVSGIETYSIYVGPGKFYDLVCREKKLEDARIQAEKESREARKNLKKGKRDVRNADGGTSGGDATGVHEHGLDVMSEKEDPRNQIRSRMANSSGTPAAADRGSLPTKKGTKESA